MLDPKQKSDIAKNWLSRSMGAKRYKRALERRLSGFTFASISRYETDGSTKGTPKENEQETKMLEYSELKGMLDKIITQLDREDMETLRVIERIENKTEKSILVDKYINLLTWDEIADGRSSEEPLSKSHAQRVHGNALQSMYKAMKEAGYDV